MKSEENPQTKIESSKHDLAVTKEHSLKCSKGNEACEYCTNEDCLQENIFFCEIRKCPCRSNHKSCLKADLGYTLEKLHSKVCDTSQMEQKNYQLFDGLIDQLSQLRDKVVGQASQILKYQKLYQIEKMFLKQVVEEGNCVNFTAKESAELWKMVNEEFEQGQDFVEQIIEQINNLKEILMKKCEAIKIIINKASQRQQWLSNRYEQYFIGDLKNFVKVFSSIVSEDVEVERLFGMFSKQIAEMEMLMRGSKNGFDINEYFELAGQSTDVLVLCKTKGGKIIGGYTPLSFKPEPDESGYVADESKQSFIFSLTQNDKFQLVKPEQAIIRDCQEKMFQFGNGDLIICNEANVIRRSGTYLDTPAYFNPKYSENTESFLMLNGNDNEQFLVQEWEVWKVYFNEEKVEDYEEGEALNQSDQQGLQGQQGQNGQDGDEDDQGQFGQQA